MSDDYTRYQENLKAEQKGMIREDILEEMQNKSEFTMDLDNLQTVKHVWVDRGAVVSCEGANHPSHRHFKVAKSRV